MSHYDDQFLNDVLQCRKQLTLPGIATHSADYAAFRIRLGD